MATQAQKGESRTLIIIGAGFLQLPLIRTARAMGLATIVFDMSSAAPGMAEADEAVVMRTRDIARCVREARLLSRRRRVDGVITAGTDASRAVAAIAAALELPGIRYTDAEAATNKVAMRRRLAEAGVPIPPFAPIWSRKELREAAAKLRYPLVLKPSENMGARGVIKIEHTDELAAAFRHSRRSSPTGEMILEEYMSGPELSIDALAFEDQIVITGIADRIIDREPYFIELGHNMPSALPAATLAEAEDVMRNAMRALGITTGAGKGDIKVTADGVKVGEVAARLSGGFMSSHTYPLHSGVNLLRAAIEIALGERPDPDNLRLKSPRVAIERCILAPPGKIVRLGGSEKMAAVAGVELIHFSRSVGEIMPPLTSNIDKVGHIIATAKSLIEAESIIAKARSFLELEVDESYGVEWREVEERARERFGPEICHVCKECNGENCASSVPGMGGVGKMESFRDNSRALHELQIVPRYLRQPVGEVSTKFNLFGQNNALPLFIAPLTGAATNLGGSLREEELCEILIEAARQSGTLAWIGDGATPERLDRLLPIIENFDGAAVVVLKPRHDESEMVRRIERVEKAGALAVAIDIDAFQLKTMSLRGVAAEAMTPELLARLRRATSLPFVLKGVLSREDLEAAIAAGVDGVVVSNHGGRVLDGLPGAARILPELVAQAAGRIEVFADGGVRSGQDLFKYLALGASAALVGRPAAIAAVGGGVAAVRFLLQSWQSELRRTLEICGIKDLTKIEKSFLLQQMRGYGRD